MTYVDLILTWCRVCLCLDASTASWWTHKCTNNPAKWINNTIYTLLQFHLRLHFQLIIYFACDVIYVLQHNWCLLIISQLIIVAKELKLPNLMDEGNAYTFHDHMHQGCMVVAKYNSYATCSRSQNKIDHNCIYIPLHYICIGVHFAIYMQLQLKYVDAWFDILIFNSSYFHGILAYSCLGYLVTR